MDCLDQPEELELFSLKDPIDRTVNTRSQFRITLPSQVPPTTETKCGWGSPRAIPYRPLGKPDLYMKLSPNLRSQHLHNESHTKCTEIRTETTTINNRVDSIVKPKDASTIVGHLRCPHRTQTDPSFALLQNAIHEGSIRRATVKYGASVFSHTIIPK
ncbi:hypothetical protein THRCLA_21276 [Thraustotheca clavata]|uniref:Uncharacterized protein n=1 Tax=Thraustotheca clavata TaxID=74557 RepID=A0A1V9ZY75_9STRA|nr:hypothetical protein THRCLA_21276 [Thraustotheca clavata]